MEQPTIDKMMERVDSKYSLVVAAAKRARELTDGSEPLAKVNSNKPVSIALCEIGEGKIIYDNERLQDIEGTEQESAEALKEMLQEGE